MANRRNQRSSVTRERNSVGRYGNDTPDTLTRRPRYENDGYESEYETEDYDLPYDEDESDVYSEGRQNIQFGRQGMDMGRNARISSEYDRDEDYNRGISRNRYDEDFDTDYGYQSRGGRTDEYENEYEPSYEYDRNEYNENSGQGNYGSDRGGWRRNEDYGTLQLGNERPQQQGYNYRSQRGYGSSQERNYGSSQERGNGRSQDRNYGSSQERGNGRSQERGTSRNQEYSSGNRYGRYGEDFRGGSYGLPVTESSRYSSRGNIGNEGYPQQGRSTSRNRRSEGSEHEGRQSSSRSASTSGNRRKSTRRSY